MLPERNEIQSDLQVVLLIPRGNLYQSQVREPQVVPLSTFRDRFVKKLRKVLED